MAEEQTWCLGQQADYGKWYDDSANKENIMCINYLNNKLIYLYIHTIITVYMDMLVTDSCSL